MLPGKTAGNCRHCSLSFNWWRHKNYRRNVPFPGIDDERHTFEKKPMKIAAKAVPLNETKKYSGSTAQINMRTVPHCFWRVFRYRKMKHLKCLAGLKGSVPRDKKSEAQMTTRNWWPWQRLRTLSFETDTPWRSWTLRTKPDSTDLERTGWRDCPVPLSNYASEEGLPMKNPADKSIRIFHGNSSLEHTKVERRPPDG